MITKANVTTLGNQPDAEVEPFTSAAVEASPFKVGKQMFEASVHILAAVDPEVPPDHHVPTIARRLGRTHFVDRRLS